MNRGARRGEIAALVALRREADERRKTHVSFPPSTVHALLDYIAARQ